jgi:hypothetical protein
MIIASNIIMKKDMRLRTKITLIIVIVVFIAISVVSFFAISWMTDKIKNEVKANIYNVAQMAANSPDIKSALDQNDPKKIIRKHVGILLKAVNNVEFIVVADMDAVRYSHPTPARIGERFVGGDEKRVIENGEIYFSEAQGTLGRSIRVFVPIYGESGGRQIGFVAVGTLTRNIDATKKAAIRLLLFAAFGSFGIGVLGAFLLARNIKKTLLGLEPAEIAKLYSEITLAELELAEKLQKRIVSEETNILEDRIEVCCVSKMAKGVGGDFYTVKKYNDTRWILSICDVSGKGVTSSLIVSLLDGIFDVYDFNKGLKSFLMYLNGFIYNTFQTEKYLTGLFLDFDENTNEIILSDSGHSLFYLIRNGDVFTCQTNKDNLPIGITGEFNPFFNRLKMQKNDMLFLYTDGLTEQTDDKDNVYSDERLKLLLKNNSSTAVKEIKQKVIEDITRFKQKQKQKDDITFILIKCL